MSSGQSAGFNPLADLTSARYAGYLNMPSADMFGPDGGALNNDSNNQDELLRMMENPIFQSQMNEMLSNPQMLDFMIQSNPQLQAMGPQARQMLQSPMFRQMLTNPEYD
ncbi:serine threonine protein kinase, CMGC group [Fusarium falciforme]|nr:serine threonine protein kinase, CMGC group [Fusarium falciforme]